jgi:hypothetical protein
MTPAIEAANVALKKADKILARVYFNVRAPRKVADRGNPAVVTLSRHGTRTEWAAPAN